MLHDIESKSVHMDKNGYLMVYYPNHPNAWKGGAVYLHRLVVENKIGRYLNKKEVVHHKDGNPLNNDISNLEIMTNSEHAIKHKTKDRILIKCLICSKEVYVTQSRDRQKYCSHKCALLSRHRGSKCPLRDDLEQMVWSVPTSTIAKEFGVSDKAVEKWCKKYNISKPSRGYWAKVKSRKG